MSKFEELTERTGTWCESRGLLEKGTLKTQLEKLREEVDELGVEIDELVRQMEEGIDSREVLIKAKTELGDGIVVQYVLSRMLNTTIEECFGLAMTKNENRKTKMVNGFLVKEGEHERV